MVTVFHRELAIPLWFLALGAVALNVSTRATSLVITLVAIVPIAFTMLPTVRRGACISPPTTVLPIADREPPHAGVTIVAGTHTRTLDDALDARTLTADDAIDLVRMDDDGGRQMASTAGPDESPDSERVER
jgi:hypothetical protein